MFFVFYMVGLPFIITVQRNVAHAHIGKLYVLCFYVAGLPFIITV